MLTVFIFHIYINHHNLILSFYSNLKMAPTAIIKEK